MSEDGKEQVINEMKASTLFSLQVDKTTGVASCAQLLVFVKYICLENVKEKFLFCSELETTTKKVQILWEKEKLFLIQQSCHGKVFAEFVMMEHQLCWVQIQASKKRLRHYLLKQKIHIVLYTDMRLPARPYQTLCKIY